MGLKAVLTAEEHGALDEGVRSFYEKTRDGAYILDAEGVDELPSVRGLVTTLAKYKEAAPSAHGLKQKLERLEELEAFGELGTAEEVRERLQRLEELEAGGGGDVDERIKALRDTYEARVEATKTKAAKDLKAKDDEIASLNGFLERKLVDSALDAAMDEVGVIPGTKKAVRALIKDEYKPKVVRDGEDRRAVITTDLGDVGIEDFMKSWAKTKDADDFMPASDNNGSAARNGGDRTRGGGPNPFAKDTRNITEQMRLMKEAPDQARLLAREAGVNLPKIAS